jgi:hypothetical protein
MTAQLLINKEILPVKTQLHPVMTITDLEELDRPLSLSGENTLSGFVLHLQDLGFN